MTMTMAAGDGSKEIYNHGMSLDPENRRVQCNYCGKVVSGFNRLQHHLGGIRGNIVECPDVPQDVKEFFKSSLLFTKVRNLAKEVGELHQPGPRLKRTPIVNAKENALKRQKAESALYGGLGAQSCVSAGEVASNDYNWSAMPREFSSKEGQGSSSIKAKRCIGRFFFENDIDFSAVESYSFHKMTEMAFSGGGDTQSRIPTFHELKGWILHDELDEIRNYVKEIRLSWPQTGCSIVLDGWTNDGGRALINIIVDCPLGPIYLRSASPADHDSLRVLLECVLEEVGIQNVVQIISHSASKSMDAMGKLLMEKYRSFFWTVSATHCISLMLEKIGMMNSIKETLDKAKSMTKFIYSNPLVLKLMRQYISSHDLIRPSKIKAAMPFLTLENIFIEKENLEHMFSSSHWQNSTWVSKIEGIEVANLVNDESFWGGVVIAVKSTIPLVRAISLVNEPKPNIGFIYETMDQVKETISQELRKRKSLYMPVWSIIDEIWNSFLHSPLHAAGYYLNPSFHYTEDFYSDSEVAGGLLISIVRMIEDKRIQDLVTQQLDVYRGCEGDFKRGTEYDKHHTLPPAVWWSRFGSHCPELQKLAVKILRLNCNGSESYGLKRDLAEKLLSGERNHVEQQKLSELVYLQYNLHLKQFNSGAKFNIIASETAMINDWTIDETSLQEVGQSRKGEQARFTNCAVDGEGPSVVAPKQESMYKS